MLSVVHLIYGPLGVEHVERFAASYRRHVAGADHELLLALNHASSDLLAPFDGLTYRTVETEGQDIDCYFAAARVCAEGRVLFLNSYSELLADGWLAKLNRPYAVAATGSFESHFDAEAAAMRVSRLYVRTYLARRAELRGLVQEFKPFPNPHLRTNAFALDRDTFLSLSYEPDGTKRGTLLFESGRRGMTTQLLNRGVPARVVGRDGRAYDIPEWPASRTFRLGSQENLLVGDNRTREYEAADPAVRSRLRLLAWGKGAEGR